MNATWKRTKRGGRSYWTLYVNGDRVGYIADDYSPRIVFKGKLYHKCYGSLSGSRMQLERLAGVETEWAKNRRKNMMTDAELMWKILSN